MKDSREFKERFARWKSGELVYENGRPLPRYQNGKSRVDTFVEQLGPILYRSIVDRGIENPGVVYNNAMRLFATETGYGTSRVAREQHNYGGVGWDGSKYYTYNSDLEFIDDFLSLLQRRYPKALAAKTPREWAHELKVRGYYEAPEAVYANNMSNMKALLTAMDKHWQSNANLYTDTPFKPTPVQLPELPTILSINKTQSYQPTVKGRVLPEVVVYGTDRKNSSTMPSVQDTLTNPYYYNMLKDWGLIDDDDDISSYAFYDMLGKGRVFPKFRGGKAGYRFIQNDDKSWSRITNAPESNLMANIVITPHGVRPKFDYESNPNYIAPRHKNEAIGPDNNWWTKQQIEKINNTRTWRSDAADIAHSVGEGALLATSLINPEGSVAVNAAYNTAKNAFASLPKTLPVSNMERRAIEVLLRSTGGKASGIDPYEIKNAVFANKKHAANVLKYVITGRGNAKSLVPGDLYTGFRVHQGWDLPSIKLPSDNDKYGDIIDAILYNKQINPEYGLIPSNEPLYDFGLTPSAIKRYTGVLKYKVIPRDNFRGFGNTIPPTLYKDITDKHLPIAYDEYGNVTRPTSISVATSDNIGADLGHYDMQIGTLNGDNVYRWLDIYEFSPKAYKKSWDLYNSDFGGDSKLTMKLKDIFLDRLDKAHTPITIQRDWFSEPYGWSSKNYGFTLVPQF